jgi:four helix bundle protein
MLRIYPVIVEMLRELGPVLRELEGRDRDLVCQARRAAQSVLLNVAEGTGHTGGNRRQRYKTALGSMRETSACLDAAEALGTLESVPDTLRMRIAHVTGTLVKLAA